MTPHEALVRLDTRICEPALVWASRLHPMTTPAAAWETCPRVTWLLWLAGLIDVPFPVLLGAGLELGRLVLGAVPATELRPRLVLDATSAWLEAPSAERLELVTTSVAEGAAYVTSANEVARPTPAQTAAIYAAHTAVMCGKLVLVHADLRLRAVHADAIGYYATRTMRPEAKGEERRGGVPSSEQLSEPHRELAEVVRRAIPWSLVREAMIRRSS